MTSGPGHRGAPRRPAYAAAALLAAVVTVVAVALGAALLLQRTPATTSDRDGSAPADPTSGASPARVGATAASQRVRFEPEALVLDGAQAEVRPVSTLDGELQVPEEVQHLGWWDGSAAAGDPFGNVVVAGHVDSATEGLGFFARLSEVQVGEQVQVRGRVSGETYALDYRVQRIERVDKDALATDSAAFDQSGDPLLVLITCTGAYLPDRGGYQQNLVVTATPVGLPRPLG